MEKVISANNANQLFWLGRYAERGYLFLHLMRKAYDEVLDVPVGEKPYSTFLEKLDIYVSNDFTTSYQMMEQIYNPETVTSLRFIIERMMDNAIVLRPQIYSESFSYIEMCRDLIRREAEMKEMNITNLQPITDWLLAFWGSIRERVTGRVYAFLEIGRLVEHLDMNIRFEYGHYRIVEAWDILKDFMTVEPDLFDQVQAQHFQQLLNDKQSYDEHKQEYKDKILQALCLLVKV
ncbi:MAG: alpha-E domain-containing protein [Bacteroidales bacterium]|nr:alpha-E domain-containing protein [Candidatus Minthousia equi]